MTWDTAYELMVCCVVYMAGMCVVLVVDNAAPTWVFLAGWITHIVYDGAFSPRWRRLQTKQREDQEE